MRPLYKTADDSEGGNPAESEGRGSDDIHPEEVTESLLGLAGILGLLLVVAVIAAVAIALVWLQHP
jgi:hypothetical protein